MPKSKQANKEEPKSLVLKGYPGIPDGTDLYNMPLELYAYYQANRPDIIEELEAKKAAFEASDTNTDQPEPEPETEGSAQEELEPAVPDPNTLQQPAEGGEN